MPESTAVEGLVLHPANVERIVATAGRHWSRQRVLHVTNALSNAKGEPVDMYGLRLQQYRAIGPVPRDLVRVVSAGHRLVRCTECHGYVEVEDTPYVRALIEARGGDLHVGKCLECS